MRIQPPRRCERYGFRVTCGFDTTGLVRGDIGGLFFAMAALGGVRGFVILPLVVVAAMDFKRGSFGTTCNVPLRL